MKRTRQFTITMIVLALAGVLFGRSIPTCGWRGWNFNSSRQWIAAILPPSHRY